MNSIIISINVDINEKRDEISLKKSSLTEMKDLLTDQLFFKLSAAILAEISSTFNSLAMRIISTKSISAILCYFLHRAVRVALKNIDLSNSAISNSAFQTVRVISDSDLQAVKIVSLTCKSCDQL